MNFNGCRTRQYECTLSHSLEYTTLNTIPSNQVFKGQVLCHPFLTSSHDSKLLRVPAPTPGTSHPGVAATPAPRPLHSWQCTREYPIKCNATCPPPLPPPGLGCHILEWLRRQYPFHCILVAAVLPDVSAMEPGPVSGFHSVNTVLSAQWAQRYARGRARESQGE